jgi:hypothetical protein
MYVCIHVCIYGELNFANLDSKLPEGMYVCMYVCIHGHRKFANPDSGLPAGMCVCIYMSMCACIDAWRAEIY